MSETPTKTAESVSEPMTVTGASRAIVRVLGSFGLAVTVILLLLVLTWLGTLEQRFRSIYDVQADYFESIVVVSRTIGATAEDPSGGFPIPLPGAYLLLAVLSANVLIGGVLRMRKNRSTIGILVTHLGIMFLLFGGMLEYHYSSKGSLAMYPGERKAAFQSYHDWDVVVTEHLADGSGKAYVIPQERFEDVEPGDRVRFESPDLPFAVDLFGYQRNARPVKAGHGKQGVDGFLLSALPPENPAERNVPGVYTTLVEPDDTKHEALLWGRENGPYRVAVADREFDVTIQPHEWELPFALELTRFVKKDYARTTMARQYSSYVKKIEDGRDQDIHITMNEPLRHLGYTFYQSSFIEDPRRGQTATVLSVVANPADRVPEYAFYVIGLGLLLHFIEKLGRWITAESRRQAHAAA